jgi:hypothetical protein
VKTVKVQNDKNDLKNVTIGERTQIAKIASSRSFFEKKMNGWTLRFRQTQFFLIGWT